MESDEYDDTDNLIEVIDETEDELLEGAVIIEGEAEEEDEELLESDIRDESGRILGMDVKSRCLKQCFKYQTSDHVQQIHHQPQQQSIVGNGDILIKDEYKTEPEAIYFIDAVESAIAAGGGGDESEAGVSLCDTDKIFDCRICGKTYDNETQLKRHFDTVHSSERRFFCSICKTGFTRHEHLKRHVFRHYNERPHKCPYCPKSFARKEYLKRHENIHSGAKPLQCTFCISRFYRKDHLLKHINRIHKHDDIKTEVV